MAGQLTIDTLKASSGVLATQNGMSGIAKAWCNYAPTTQTINGSFNISSVTYNGTGNYTFNFSTAMPNATYSALCTMTDGGSYNSQMTGMPYNGATYSTTQLQVQGTYGGSAYNAPRFSIAVFA